MDINLQRVYGAPPRNKGNGIRVLVDRLWPRGMAKTAAPWDEWDRDVAPPGNSGAGLRTIPPNGVRSAFVTARSSMDAQ